MNTSRTVRSSSTRRWAQRCCCCWAAASSPPRSCKGSKGYGGGWLLINFGWGLGVYMRRVRRLPQRRAPQPGRHRVPADGRATSPAASRSSTSRANSSVPSSARSSPGWRSSSTSTSRRIRATKLARVLHRAGDPQLRLEHRHRGHRHVRADLRDPHLRWHADPGRPAVRGAAGGRDRRLARWSHRVRHQPGPRPRPPHRARHPADQGQGRRPTGVTPGCRSSARSSARCIATLLFKAIGAQTADRRQSRPAAPCRSDVRGASRSRPISEPRAAMQRQSVRK